MLLLWYKSASCCRKWRQTGDGKCNVHSSNLATASVSEQPTASPPNMKHVWGLICSPLMGCQNSGIRGQPGSRASPLSLTQPSAFTKATGRPLIWATISCLDAVLYTHTESTHTCSTKKSVHTNSQWLRAKVCIKHVPAHVQHTHTFFFFFFISKGLVGSLPCQQQSLTKETEDFPSWATFYRITMQTQLPPRDIFSIFNMPPTLSFLSVKIFPVIPCLPLPLTSSIPALLLSSPGQFPTCHTGLWLGGWCGRLLRRCVDWLVGMFTCRKVEDTGFVWICQWPLKLSRSAVQFPTLHFLCVQEVIGGEGVVYPKLVQNCPRS